MFRIYLIRSGTSIRRTAGLRQHCRVKAGVRKMTTFLLAPSTQAACTACRLKLKSISSGHTPYSAYGLRNTECFHRPPFSKLHCFHGPPNRNMSKSFEGDGSGLQSYFTEDIRKVQYETYLRAMSIKS